MSNTKQKARTFEIKMILTVSSDRMIERMLEMKADVLSGQAQRDFLKDGVEKVKITFTEIQGGNNG